MTEIGTWLDAEKTSFLRASDGGCVPVDPANRDYQDALLALESGDTIADYVAPPVETPPLQAWQLKTVVALAFPPPVGGAQLDGLRAYISSAMSDPVQQNIALSRLESPPDGLYYITDPLFSNAELMAATGKTEADIQAMWTQGLGLQG